MEHRGTSVKYRIKRLKKSHPELAKWVIDGEITANKAMRLAGLAEASSTYYHTARGCALLFQRLSKEEQDKFMREYC